MSDSQPPPTATTTSTSDPQPPNGTISRDELVELVRAIQFGKPQLSQTKIHKEITQELSRKQGYEFLSLVKISDVKKAWKQLQKDQQEGMKGPNSSQNSDLLERLQAQKQPPQLYTVGDQNTPSIAYLVQHLHAATLAAGAVAGDVTQGEETALERDYVHIFLDVPLDQSGSKPHQALINFQTGKSSKNKKLKQILDDNGRTIVKIQRAAPTSPTDTTQHPMLLYDATRTRKTFVHPGEEYDRLLKWMIQEGQEGALGHTGGSKAYFYARLTVTKGGLPDIVSVDVTQLAPAQEW